MDMRKCYICGRTIDFDKRQISLDELSLDEYENMGRLCPECRQQIKGKIALVIEEDGKRTGELVFMTKKMLDAVSNIYPDGYSIYIVPSEAVKILVKRILELR